MTALTSMSVRAQIANPPTPGPSSTASGANDDTINRNEDAISRLIVTQDADGRWLATCEIAMAAKRFPPLLTINASATSSPTGPFFTAPVPVNPNERARSYTVELVRPDVFSDSYNTQLNIVERTHKQVQTEWVVATLKGLKDDGRPYEIKKVIKQTIKWPDRQIWEADRSIRNDGPSTSLANAVRLIDEGTRESLFDARTLLERLLLKNGKITGAYIEMARVAMKTNWGPEGLHQARRYLDSALSIDSTSVNALILRGYVSAHQGHYKDAEKDFTSASQSNPPNLWLWSNWGELLMMQGQTEAAIKMYQKAINHPPTHDTYDRARADAFEKLIAIYEGKHDLDALEKLHKNRVRDFGEDSCHVVSYALFAVQEKDDPDVAIDLLKDANPSDCQFNSSKEALGMAYYMKWSRASEAKRLEYINRARVYFPVGSRLFYRLGSSVVTLKAATSLVKAGEMVDQKDNDGMTALAYAVKDHEYDTAGRLIKVGANPTATVGEQAVPVALLPVFTNDPQGIRLMKKWGVNYSSVYFQGVSAMNYARKMNNKKLLDALGSGSPDI